MPPASELLQFSAEPASQPPRPPWKVLSVEDDAGYQSSLLHALSRLRIDNRPLELLRARSALEAARLLPEHPDICVILLDVVLEQDDAGLRLVHTIRKVIRNNQVRIVLLTGQPGMAPETEVMQQFDIDDYWCKSELTVEHLSSVLIGNIRTWERTSQLEHARQGLQLLLDAAQTLSRHHDLNGHLDCISHTLSALLRDQQGLLITACAPDGTAARVLAAHGCFRPLRQADADACAALARRLSLLTDDTLSFRDGELLIDVGALGQTRQRCRILVRLDTAPQPADHNLLRLFCEQVGTSLANLALYDQLTDLAYRDPLLALPNRNAFTRTLACLPDDTRAQHQLLVLTLPELNELVLHFGEGFGNRVLHAVRDRLLPLLPADGVLARSDRHGFALLLPPGQPGEPIAAALQVPFDLDGGEHLIAAAAALLPLEQVSDQPAAQLLRMAEQTLTRGLEQGHRVCVYQAEQEQQARQRYQLLLALRQALNQQAFELVFQPKVALASGRLVGFEALVRWPQPDGRIGMPAEFIPVAEAAGLISELDLTVLALTLRAQQTLIDAGIRVPMSFNSASIDLIRADYFEQMLSLIEQSDVPAPLLELEITESQAIPEYSRIADPLQRLIALGVGVSIDDFGTGYSSLAHIGNLTATALKIDRSFILALEHSTEIEHVIRMIIDLGDQLGFSVIAEGIETEQQRQTLLNLGCQQGQGYLYARPMPLAEALAWAQEHR